MVTDPAALPFGFPQFLQKRASFPFCIPQTQRQPISLGGSCTLRAAPQFLQKRASSSLRVPQVQRQPVSPVGSCTPRAAPQVLSAFMPPQVAYVQSGAGRCAPQTRQVFVSSAFSVSQFGQFHMDRFPPNLTICLLVSWAICPHHSSSCHGVVGGIVGSVGSGSCVGTCVGSGSCVGTCAGFGVGLGDHCA